jgi:predicted nucleic acid-binding protein
MKVLFADTFYFVALISARDKLHTRAKAMSQSKVRYVTTDWIITEVVDAMSKGNARRHVPGLINYLRTSPVWEVVPFSEEIFERALEFHARFTDKEWTLTDCTSFIVMQERGVTEALTGDRHFEQAGFTALLQ